MTADSEVCEIFTQVFGIFREQGPAGSQRISAALDELSDLNDDDPDATYETLLSIACAAEVYPTYAPISRNFAAIADVMVLQSLTQVGQLRTDLQQDAFMMLVFAQMSAPRNSVGHVKAEHANPIIAAIDRLIESEPGQPLKDDISKSRALLEIRRDYVPLNSDHISATRLRQLDALAAQATISPHRGLQ